MTHYHLTLVSGNKKVGPIPVSTSYRSTCPPTCPLMGNGCYAENFPLKLLWDRVTEGTKGTDFQTFLKAIAKLPEGTAWRHNQAGDLPGEGGKLDREANLTLARVGTSRRKQPICYTHYEVLPGSHPDARHNARVIQDMEMTINLSADNLSEADAMADLGIGPVVTVLPYTDTGKYRHTKTPAGRDVVMCPAEWVEGMTCARCKLCAKSNTDRNGVVVGFFTHGAGKKKATAVCMETNHA